MGGVPTGVKLHVTSGMPVPLNGTFRVEVSGSFDGILSVALLLPVVVGENFTLTVQLADGVRVSPEQ